MGISAVPLLSVGAANQNETATKPPVTQTKKLSNTKKGIIAGGAATGAAFIGILIGALLKSKDGKATKSESDKEKSESSSAANFNKSVDIINLNLENLKGNREELLKTMPELAKYFMINYLKLRFIVFNAFNAVANARVAAENARASAENARASAENARVAVYAAAHSDAAAAISLDAFNDAFGDVFHDGTLVVINNVDAAAAAAKDAYNNGDDKAKDEAAFKAAYNVFKEKVPISKIASEFTKGFSNDGAIYDEQIKSMSENDLFNLALVLQQQGKVLEDKIIELMPK